MKSINIEELPPEIRKTLLNQQVDIFIKVLEDAGLLIEFLTFVESEEVFNVKDFDELCEKFAIKHSDKLFIVPKEERYNMCFYQNMKELSDE